MGAENARNTYPLKQATVLSHLMIETEHTRTSVLLLARQSTFGSSPDRETLGL